MTTEERVIARIAEANPFPESASPTAQERAEAERVLGRVLDDAPSRGPRRRPHLARPRAGVLAPVASLLVVLVVAAVILRTGGTATTTGSNPSGGLSITFRAEPTPQVPRITAAAMSREIALMRARLRTLGRGFTVTQSGAGEIVVTGPKAGAAERARIVRLAGQSAQLLVYDWEKNVLTPNGKTVASQLITQDPTATAISQGGATGPGTPGAGGSRCMTRRSLPLSSRRSRCLRRSRARGRLITFLGLRAVRRARWWPRPMGRRRWRVSIACSMVLTRA